jgi:hypothetical protein
LDEAFAWFEQACRGASPDSLGVMLAAWSGHADPRVAAFARDFASAIEVAA